MMQSRDLDMVTACRQEVRRGGRQGGGRGKGVLLEGVGKGIKDRGVGQAMREEWSGSSRLPTFLRRGGRGEGSGVDGLYWTNTVA